MESIGNQSLRVEHVSSGSLANGHEQVNVQAEPCDTDAGIFSIGGSKVGIVMVVMVSMRVSSMQTVVRERGHGGQIFGIPKSGVDLVYGEHRLYIGLLRSRVVK